MIGILSMNVLRFFLKFGFCGIFVMFLWVF